MMEAPQRAILKSLVLDLRHELEGHYDAEGWPRGDLANRLAEIGVRPDGSFPVGQLKLSPEDHHARRVVEAFTESRIEAGEDRTDALREFVRNAAYSWANRLLALRCMEA